MLLVIRKELPISVHCRSIQKDKELGILEAETAQWSCYNAILEGTSFSSLDCNVMWVRNFDSQYQNRPFLFSLPAHAYMIFFFFSTLPISYVLSDFVLGYSVFKRFPAWIYQKLIDHCFFLISPKREASVTLLQLLLKLYKVKGVNKTTLIQQK